MDIAYLERPLIEDVSYEITETRVAINSSSTCFVSCVLPERCRKDDMLDRYRRVLRMAKAQGVKISYSAHIRKTIMTQWSEYEAARENQERLFEKLRELAKCIQQRGIHMGFVDDEYLAQLNRICDQLAMLRCRDRVISRIAEFDYALSFLERDLSKDKEHYDMIRL